MWLFRSGRFGRALSRFTPVVVRLPRRTLRRILLARCKIARITATHELLDHGLIVTRVFDRFVDVHLGRGWGMGIHTLKDFNMTLEVGLQLNERPGSYL